MMGSKWMVDAKGKGESGDDDIKEVMQTLDFEGFVASQGGLADAVQKWADECGYRISDRGGCIDSWHVGVPFDDLEQAIVYLTNMTAKFSTAIGHGLLRFELKTWSREFWK